MMRPDGPPRSVLTEAISPRLQRFFRRLALTALLALVFIQAAHLVGRLSPASETRRPTLDLVVGDSVDVLPTLDVQGQPSTYRPPTDQPTLILAYHSECGHSLRVMPRWKDWIDAGSWRNRVTLLAVTSEVYPIGEHHLVRNGLAIKSVTLETQRGGLPAQLAKKTPWIYAITSTGVVVYEGHGDEIEQAFRALAAADSDNT